jgi:hypothetical protein
MKKKSKLKKKYKIKKRIKKNNDKCPPKYRKEIIINFFKL